MVGAATVALDIQSIQGFVAQGDLTSSQLRRQKRAVPESWCGECLGWWQSAGPDRRIHVGDRADQKRRDEPAEFGRTLMAVNNRHERLIEALLTLSTSEQELTDRTVLDLADIAAYVVDELRTDAAKAGVKVRLEPSPAPVTGDPVLLERLVSNLATNGLRHNNSGGWVILKTSIMGDTSMLEVHNSGPTVLPHEAESLCEPFHRLGADAEPASRPGERGFGLGLSIVRAITRAHGGNVTIQPRPEGGDRTNRAPLRPLGPSDRWVTATTGGQGGEHELRLHTGEAAADALPWTPAKVEGGSRRMRVSRRGWSARGPVWRTIGP